MIYIEEQVTKGIMISKMLHQSDPGDEEAKDFHRVPNE